MRARVVIIVDVIPQGPAQVIFTDDDQMIETLSPNRADYAFGVWILEWRSRRGWRLFNLHPLYSQSKFCPVNLISIPKQIARSRVFREGFDELSGRPFSRRMRCWAVGLNASFRTATGDAVRLNSDVVGSKWLLTGLKSRQLFLGWVYSSPATGSTCCKPYFCIR